MATGLAAPTPQQFFLDSGSVNAGGSVETYLVGTSTPVATYTDYDLATPNSTTVALNSAGRPTSGGIFLDSTIAYKFIEKDAAGATVKTYNIAALFNGPYTIAGNATISGTLAVTGATTLSSTLACGLITASKNQNATSTWTFQNTDATNSSSRASISVISATVNASLTSIAGTIASLGTTSNHAVQIVTNNTLALTLATNQAATFASTVDATAYKVGGVAGKAAFGPAAPASITIVNGIVTACS